MRNRINTKKEKQFTLRSLLPSIKPHEIIKQVKMNPMIQVGKDVTKKIFSYPIIQSITRVGVTVPAVGIPLGIAELLLNSRQTGRSIGLLIAEGKLPLFFGNSFKGALGKNAALSQKEPIKGSIDKAVGIREQVEGVEIEPTGSGLNEHIQNFKEQGKRIVANMSLIGIVAGCDVTFTNTSANHRLFLSNGFALPQFGFANWKEVFSYARLGSMIRFSGTVGNAACFFTLYEPIKAFAERFIPADKKSGPMAAFAGVVGTGVLGGLISNSTRAYLNTLAKWYEISLMSDDTLLKKGILYLKEKDGKITYSVITPDGHTVRDVPIDSVKLPERFTLENLNKVKNQILELTTKNGHTAPPHIKTDANGHYRLPKFIDGLKIVAPAEEGVKTLFSGIDIKRLLRTTTKGASISITTCIGIYAILRALDAKVFPSILPKETLNDPAASTEDDHDLRSSVRVEELPSEIAPTVSQNKAALFSSSNGSVAEKNLSELRNKL